MNKKSMTALFIGLFTTSLLSAQVGVNTKNPLGVFHVDPKSDTEHNAGSPINDGDDVIVTADGNIGIGTAVPTAKVHIKTAGTVTKPIPGFRLQDGNEGAGKFLTLINNAGSATWKTLSSQDAVYYKKPTTSPDLPLINTPNYYKTSASITLQKGRWIVMVTMLANKWGPIDSTGSFWLNTTFADAATVINDGQPLANIVTPDIEGSQLISLVAMMGYNTTGILTGAVVINNRKPIQTYYYMAGGITLNAGITSAYLRSFGGIWGEDSIVAFKIPSDI